MARTNPSKIKNLKYAQNYVDVKRELFGGIRSSEMKSKSMTMEEARVITPPERVRL